jgi:DNA replication protein DnaC
MESHEIDEYRGKSWRDVFDSVEGMVLNDLGKENRSREYQAQDANYKLGRLIRARHEEQKPIFITTNFPVLEPKSGGQTFASTYGSSIWSLVQEMTWQRPQINAPDLRDKTKKDDDDDD